jgi:hypothetical protein
METSKNQNLISVNLLTWIFLVFTLFVTLQGNAQTGSKNSLLEMIEEDRTTIDAIAGCDKDVQTHILQVAQTPEVLNKIEELQKSSQNQFRAIIDNYDRDAQSAFYEMARYPDLITELVSNGKPSVSEVSRIVSKYPEDIHETAINYSLRYFDVLLHIDRLNNEIDKEFKYYLEPYNHLTRENVSALIGYPEIVSALVDDKQFTTLLGETYRDDPEWVRYQLQQISRELADRNKDDLEAYRNQIQNDPEAYNEMLEASEKFARENNEVRYIRYQSDPVMEVRVINSYPYWYGYPYWYSYPYWRPRPIFYHTGFYRNNFGNIIFVGLPSFHFLHWQSHYHPAMFPHLSYNYYSYYQNHYMKQYRESPHSFPHQGFFRSIETNVINNPRVNNSALVRIDHQRGNNIVRKPNTTVSRSSRSGYSGGTRQSETTISRQRSASGGTTYRGGNETYSRNGRELKSSGINNGDDIKRDNRQRTSSGREASSGQRSSVSAKKETSSVTSGSSRRSERREARTVNRQPSGRRAAAANGPSAPSVSSDGTKNERRSGRRK